MNNQGLTLIELLVTMSIIAILGALLYPSFNGLLAEHHRQQAEQTLLIMAKNMEVYKVEHESYLDITLLDIKPVNLPTDNNYQFSISQVTDESFQLMAQPNIQQAHRDQACGTLTINQLGERGSSAPDKKNNCWSV